MVPALKHRVVARTIKFVSKHLKKEEMPLILNIEVIFICYFLIS